MNQVLFVSEENKVVPLMTGKKSMPSTEVECGTPRLPLPYADKYTIYLVFYLVFENGVQRLVCKCMKELLGWWRG